jgi:hypothetical protein
MRDMHKTLYKFWSQFTLDGAPIPAFPTGRVPDGQAFPYITFEVVEGEYFSTAFPVAVLWCQKPPEANINIQDQRATLMDQVAEAIPLGGVWLTMPGGGVILRRNGANWLRYYDPPPDDVPTGEPVIGGRISYSIQFFVR